MTISFLASSCLAAMVALTASSAVKPAPSVLVATESGWVNEAPPGSKVLGGFLTIANRRDRSITLQRVESPLFGSVQMHAVRKEDGREIMKPMATVTIPAGSRVRFVPGGSHLMLMNPKRPLKAGDKVKLTLDFGKDGRHEVTLPVQSRKVESEQKRDTDAKPPQHEDHHHH